MSAETILKLIEEVDPADTAKLDEIDARAFCYFSGRDPDVLFTEGSYAPVKQWYHLFYNSSFERLGGKHYTCSRDALKAIRPEGWEWYMSQNGTKNLYLFGCSEDSIGTNQMQSPMLPTEELAELHVIVQTIEYERGKNDR